MVKLTYGKQWIDQDDIDAVIKVLKGDWLTQGPSIREFEKAIADLVGVRYAVAFCNGTAALHGAMFAAGIEKGDSILTTPITFVGTSNSAIYLGATPQFVDIDMNSYCLDIDKIEKNITETTKVLAPVDYAGFPVNFKEIQDIASDNNLVTVEDAAHALGAKRYGKFVGQEADMTMFSFHPVKHITTAEGGIIVTNNELYDEKLRMFRNHGNTKDSNKLEKQEQGPWYYEMHHLGYNYRITDIQTTLGLSQLKKLKSFVKRRNEIAKKYNAAFKDHPNIITPPMPDYPGSIHGYHIYPLLVKNISKKSLFHKLKEQGVLCQVHYIPVHLQPYYKHNFNYKEGDFPKAEDFYEREITIPLYPKMTNNDINYVIEKIIDNI